MFSKMIEYSLPASAQVFTLSAKCSLHSHPNANGKMSSDPYANNRLKCFLDIQRKSGVEPRY